MRKRAILLAVLFVASALAPFASAGVDFESGLAVFLWFDQEEIHTLGETVSIDFMVFDSCEFHDADDVQFQVGNRDITPQRMAEGRYRATFDLLESDLMSGGKVIDITAWAFDNPPSGPWETAHGYIYIDYMEVEILTPDAHDEFAMPGDVLDFTVRFSHDGALVDPDAGTIEATIQRPGSTIKVQRTLTRVGTGVYTGNMTTGSGMLRVSNMYRLDVTADYTTPRGTVGGFNATMFEVNPLPIWLEKVSVTETSASVKLHVQELDGIPYDHSIEGHPLPGVQVSITHKYRDQTATYKEVPQTGHTDVDGVASFELDYPDIYDYDTVIEVFGKITFYHGWQDYRFYIPMRDGIDPSLEYRLEVDPVDYTHPPTDIVTLKNHARWDGQPLANHEVFCYVDNGGWTFYTDPVTTDAQGYFEVEIKKPEIPEGQESETMTAYFQAKVGGDWDHDSYWFYVGEPSIMGEFNLTIDGEATVTVDKFKEYGTVSVTVDHPDSDGEEERAMLVWGLGLPEDYEWSSYSRWVENHTPVRYDWRLWPQRHMEVNYVPCDYVAGEWRGEFYYPGHLPDGTRIFVYGGITFLDERPARTVGAVAKDLRAQPGKGWPTVTISGMPPVVMGTWNVTGTARCADGGLLGVEVRVDGGAWRTVEGLEGWYYHMDTTAMAYGPHLIEARAWNSDHYSKVTNRTFATNQRPTVSITHPINGSHHFESMVINGTAWDDHSLHNVTVRMDGGPWMDTTGTNEWVTKVPLTGLSSGDHKVEAAAWAEGGSHVSELDFVDFIVDRPPEVTITLPLAGAEVSGVQHVNGTASDDLDLQLVEVRVDGGPWEAATGADTWTYELDTTTLSEGCHTVEARAWDGYFHTLVLPSVSFTVDNPPVVTGVNVVDGQLVSGVYRVEGNASDDGSVERVEVQVDDGEWITAEGTDSWSYDLDTSALERGEHTLRVRSYDGTDYSDEEEFTIVVDAPPEVGEVSLEAGSTVAGVLTVSGNASDDDGVESVEVRVDGGEWVEVTGTDEWSYELDTNGMASGTHTLEVRGYDGEQYSEPLSIEFTVDNPPVVDVLSPEIGAKYKGELDLNGTAIDDGDVVRVEYRLDGGDWVVLDGTATWSGTLSLEDVKAGEHTLEVRAYDGSQYSEVHSIDFEVERDEEGSPGFGAMASALALMGGLVLALRRRK